MSRLGSIASGLEARQHQGPGSNTSIAPTPFSARTSGEDTSRQQLQHHHSQGVDGMTAGAGGSTGGVYTPQPYIDPEGFSDGVSGMMAGSGAESEEREALERQMSSAVGAAENFLWFDIEAHAIPSPGEKSLTQPVTGDHVASERHIHGAALLSRDFPCSNWAKDPDAGLI